MKEYSERQAEDVKAIEKDMSEEDLKHMRELDKMYGAENRRKRADIEEDE